MRLLGSLSLSLYLSTPVFSILSLGVGGEVDRREEDDDDDDDAATRRIITLLSSSPTPSSRTATINLWRVMAEVGFCLNGQPCYSWKGAPSHGKRGNPMLDFP